MMNLRRRRSGPKALHRRPLEDLAMRLSTNVIRNFAAVAVSLILATAGLSTVAAQEKPKASPPVLVTSLGQSLDAFQIQLVVRRAGIPYKYDARAEVDQLDEVKTLFLGVGASLKRFGEAGITLKDELARANSSLRVIPASPKPLRLAPTPRNSVFTSSSWSTSARASYL